MTQSLPLERRRLGQRPSVFGIGLATLLGVAVYLLTLAWSPRSPRPLLHAAAPPGCDLHSAACSATFDDGGSVRLEIAPKTLSPAEVLRIRVDTAGLEADTATIEFSGLEMNMGLIGHALASSGAGSFAGRAVLPVCTRRQMTWQAVVTLAGADRRYRALFVFNTNRR